MFPLPTSLWDCSQKQWLQPPLHPGIFPALLALDPDRENRTRTKVSMCWFYLHVEMRVWFSWPVVLVRTLVCLSAAFRLHHNPVLSRSTCPGAGSFANDSFAFWKNLSSEQNELNLPQEDSFVWVSAFRQILLLVVVRERIGLLTLWTGGNCYFNSQDSFIDSQFCYFSQDAVLL